MFHPHIEPTTRLCRFDPHRTWAQVKITDGRLRDAEWTVDWSTCCEDFGPSVPAVVDCDTAHALAVHLAPAAGLCEPLYLQATVLSVETRVVQEVMEHKPQSLIWYGEARGYHGGQYPLHFAAPPECPDSAQYVLRLSITINRQAPAAMEVLSPPFLLRGEQTLHPAAERLHGAHSTLACLPDEIVLELCAFLSPLERGFAWPLRPLVIFPVLLAQQRSAFATLLQAHGCSQSPVGTDPRFMARCPAVTVPLAAVSFDDMKLLRAGHRELLCGGEWQLVARPERLARVRTLLSHGMIWEGGICRKCGSEEWEVKLRVSEEGRRDEALALVLAFMSRNTSDIRPVVMGGFPLSCIFGSPYEDVDIFMVQPEWLRKPHARIPSAVGLTASVWTLELLDCAGLDMSAATVIRGASSFVLMFQYRGAMRRFRFVIGVFASVSALLLSADMDITQVCVDWRGGWWVTPKWLRAAALCTVFVNPHFQNGAIVFKRYPKRLFKYHRRGFQIAMPSHRLGGPQGPTVRRGSLLEVLLQMLRANQRFVPTKGRDALLDAHVRRSHHSETRLSEQEAASSHVMLRIADFGGLPGMVVMGQGRHPHVGHRLPIVLGHQEYCICRYDDHDDRRRLLTYFYQVFDPLAIDYGLPDPLCHGDRCQDPRCPAFVLRAAPREHLAKVLNARFWQAWCASDCAGPWPQEAPPSCYHLVFPESDAF